MDRTSNGEASMYLSFDSESTMNSLAYKTTNDISAVSNMEVDNSQDSHMNSTLEALRDETDCATSFLKTVKKVETLVQPSPMRAAGVFPKNILKEYNAVCSTPTKEQLMRTVQISRGSEGETCIDLGQAFRGMEDEKQAMHVQVMPIVEENKENTTHMESEEVLTLSSGSSSSSSVECVVTSVIYQRTTTALSTTEEESLEELVECVQKSEATSDADDPTPKASDAVETTPKVSIEDDAKPKVSGNADLTPTSNAGAPPKISNVENIRVKEEKHLVELAKATNSTSTNNKPKRSIPVPKNIRKSMCEPDLQANRPSRILSNGNKRTSLAAVSNNKTKAENIDIASDIPKLLDTLLKITNAVEKKEKHAVEKPCESGDDKPKPLKAAPKGRISMMPSQAQTGDKRPYNLAQRRMSVVVKTTLNSPARKIARKSTLPNGPQIRRSVMPQPVLARRSVMPQSALARRSVMPPPAAAQPAIKNDAFAVRRSMLPMGRTKTTTMTTTRTTVATTMCTSNVLTAASSKENTTNAKQTMRTSIYPQGTEQKSSATNSKPKTSEMSFVCNICACKFRIKSLLDAHKRSHEDDMPAGCIKKPSVRTTATAVPTVTAPSANQCKYCDKKFALVRALHIHLMQNCTKIPPIEKRKLQYTEMNHVEKAQLPEIFHHSANSQSSSLSNSQTNSIGNLNAAVVTSQLVQKSHSNLSSAPMSSTESLIENKDITIIANKIVSAVSTEMSTSAHSSTQMAPPSVNKVKVKKTAHAGVYRTPNKSIICHTCKKSFKTIIEHINHNMMEHSKTASANGNNSNEQMETSANSST